MIIVYAFYTVKATLVSSFSGFPIFVDDKMAAVLFPLKTKVVLGNMTLNSMQYALDSMQYALDSMQYAENIASYSNTK